MSQIQEATGTKPEAVRSTPGAGRANVVKVGRLHLLLRSRDLPPGNSVFAVLASD